MDEATSERTVEDILRDDAEQHVATVDAIERLDVTDATRNLLNMLAVYAYSIETRVILRPVERETVEAMFNEIVGQVVDDIQRRRDTGDFELFKVVAAIRAHFRNVIAEPFREERVI